MSGRTTKAWSCIAVGYRDGREKLKLAEQTDNINTEDEEGARPKRYHTKWAITTSIRTDQSDHLNFDSNLHILCIYI